VLVAAPAASAKPKKITLKGTVVGHATNKFGVGLTIVSVAQGAKRVGKLEIGAASCAGLICQSGGTANLKVGKITGNASLLLRWTYSGPGAACAIGAPTCKPSKYGIGKIMQGSTTEAIRVNTSKIPTTNGSSFGIVLG
jgi:hypothetical protein